MGATQERPTRRPAAQSPARGGQWHSRRALLGAWGAVVRQVQKLGLGHQPLLPGGPRRAHRPLGGPTLSKGPARVAPGRQVLVPEDRRTGAAALSSWLGRARPASQALSNSGPPASRWCTAPPRALGTRLSSALGPDDPRPSKRQAPDLLADRGGAR